MLKRYIEDQITQDLKRKMVFIAGPRQCGKTTLAENIAKQYKSKYYNWDKDEDKRLIKTSSLDFEKQLWIFDELHKYRYWRNWIKGIFDVNKHDKRILVTGSAKLDHYSRGGDSLQGRYFFHRLHPLTLAEILKIKTDIDYESIWQMNKDISNQKNAMEGLETLMKLGGFPEPFLSGSEREANRWRNLYATRVIREDVRDLENVVNLDKMELLYDHLPNTVGSVSSINSLREDLEVSFDAVKHWISIFENLYLCFQLAPLGSKQLVKKIRAVKKEKKLYLWDWTSIKDEAARFENLVAVHLLRLTHLLEDFYGLKIELRYFRNTRKQEVDFIIVKDFKPWVAIEVKLSEQELDSNLKYLLEQVEIPYAFQIHLKGNLHRKIKINKSELTIMPAWRFLANLS